MTETGAQPKEFITILERISNEFVIRLDRKPPTWEERMVLYVGYLITQNKKSTTIRSYISAIRSVLRDDDVSLNEDKYLLTSLTKACRLKNDQVRTRLPIQQGVLEVLIKHIRIYLHNPTLFGEAFLCNFFSCLLWPP